MLVTSIGTCEMCNKYGGSFANTSGSLQVHAWILVSISVIVSLVYLLLFAGYI